MLKLISRNNPLPQNGHGTNTYYFIESGEYFNGVFVDFFDVLLSKHGNNKGEKQGTLDQRESEVGALGTTVLDLRENHGED